MSKKKEKQFDLEAKINEIVDAIIAWFKDLFSGRRSSDEIINIFFTIIIMFFLLWLLKVPFVVLNSLGKGLIEFTFSPLDRVLFIIWEIIIELVYLVFALFIIVIIVKRIRYTSSRRAISKKNEEKMEVKVEPLTNEKISVYVAVKIILKILIAMAMIPFILFNIGLFIILGMLLGLWLEGTVLVGAIFITIGIFLIMSAIMGIIFKFLFEGEIK